MCLSRISFPIHENARFRGLGPGYLLYLHDFGVILSDGEESVN